MNHPPSPPPSSPEPPHSPPEPPGSPQPPRAPPSPPDPHGPPEPHSSPLALPKPSELPKPPSHPPQPPIPSGPPNIPQPLSVSPHSHLMAPPPPNAPQPPDIAPPAPPSPPAPRHAVTPHGRRCSWPPRIWGHQGAPGLGGAKARSRRCCPPPQGREHDPQGPQGLHWHGQGGVTQGGAAGEPRGQWDPHSAPQPSCSGAETLRTAPRGGLDPRYPQTFVLS